ncbi:MAG: hypothetical protein IKT02_07705 [Bacteroidales bacterium]|nr:hypothetical protein [Bacteroidales bacterium]
MRKKKTDFSNGISCARKRHYVLLSDDEWNEIGRLSEQLNLSRADYIRRVSLGYKPQKTYVPHPEFWNELMAVRADLRKHFSFVNSQGWSAEERKEKLAEAKYFVPWNDAIFGQIIPFIEKWMNIL